MVERKFQISCSVSRGMHEWNKIGLQRVKCMCMCISGLEIIYIQVANLTAPVVCVAYTHLCSLFVYNPDTGWLLHSDCVQDPVLCTLTSSLFLFFLSITHSSAHIPSLSNEFSECVNIISQLLFKHWKVSVGLQFAALSFLCESDRQTPIQQSLTCAKHVMIVIVNNCPDSASVV